MGERNLQCSNCGHLHSTEHNYYSEDFAYAILRKRQIALSWCRHCCHITEYRQRKLFGLIPTAQAVVTNNYHLNDLFNQDYHGDEMDSRGGIFQFHVHRMIWYSIEAYAKLSRGENASIKDTLELLLEKVSPLSAAFAILGVSNTSRSIALEEQIEYGIYQSSTQYDFISQAKAALESNPEWINSSQVLEILTEAKLR